MNTATLSAVAAFAAAHNVPVDSVTAEFVELNQFDGWWWRMSVVVNRVNKNHTVIKGTGRIYAIGSTVESASGNLSAAYRFHYTGNRFETAALNRLAV